MACADGLSLHPDKFKVTLIGEPSVHRRIERMYTSPPSGRSVAHCLHRSRSGSRADAQAYCGGQAFSIPIDKDRYGSEWMNQGVQGGSYIYQ